MVRYLRPLAIVLFISAAVNAFVALLSFGAAALIGFTDSGPVREDLGDASPAQLIGLYAGFGVFTLAMGACHAFAGLDVWKMRSRNRAIVLTVLGLFSAGACCCVPLSPIGVAVFGGLVLLNADVQKAFALAAQNGWNLDQVVAAMTGAPVTVNVPSRGGPPPGAGSSGGGFPPPSGGGFGAPPSGGGFGPPSGRPPAGGSTPPPSGSVPPGPPPPRRG